MLKFLVMKDMILNIKKKAITLDLRYWLYKHWKSVNNLKKQIKILDEFLKISNMWDFYILMFLLICYHDLYIICWCYLHIFFIFQLVF